MKQRSFPVSFHRGLITDSWWVSWFLVMSSRLPWICRCLSALLFFILSLIQVILKITSWPAGNKSLPFLIVVGEFKLQRKSNQCRDFPFPLWPWLGVEALHFPQPHHGIRSGARHCSVPLSIYVGLCVVFSTTYYVISVSTGRWVVLQSIIRAALVVYLEVANKLYNFVLFWKLSAKISNLEWLGVIRMCDFHFTVGSYTFKNFLLTYQFLWIRIWNHVDRSASYACVISARTLSPYRVL